MVDIYRDAKLRGIYPSHLQALAIKSEVKVAMMYKNFKAVAMRCKNKGKPKDVPRDCVIL